MARSSYTSFLKKQDQLNRHVEREANQRSARDAAGAHVARVDRLRSAHRECSEPVDWRALAATLPPPRAFQLPSAKAAAMRRRRALEPLGPAEVLPDVGEAAARDLDQLAQAVKRQEAESEEQTKLAALARAVLREEKAAFHEVLADQAFAEISEDGALKVDFEVHSAQLVEARIEVQPSNVVPSEVHSLTSTGKLSTKSMPRLQFVELYQDYVCSLVLRVSREIHALLPVQATLITALSTDGFPAPSPVLSTVVRRADLSRLPFDSLDPSDALDTLETRTNFKSSRRTGALQPIVAFVAREVRLTANQASLASTRELAEQLLEELE